MEDVLHMAYGGWTSFFFAFFGIVVLQLPQKRSLVTILTIEEKT